MTQLDNSSGGKVGDILPNCVVIGKNNHYFYLGDKNNQHKRFDIVLPKYRNDQRIQSNYLNLPIQVGDIVKVKVYEVVISHDGVPDLFVEFVELIEKAQSNRIVEDLLKAIIDLCDVGDGVIDRLSLEIRIVVDFFKPTLTVGELSDLDLSIMNASRDLIGLIVQLVKNQSPDTIDPIDNLVRLISNLCGIERTVINKYRSEIRMILALIMNKRTMSRSTLITEDILDRMSYVCDLNQPFIDEIRPVIQQVIDKYLTTPSKDQTDSDKKISPN